MPPGVPALRMMPWNLGRTRMRRRRFAAGGLLVAACWLFATMAPLASAAEEKDVRIRFEYGTDRESWFWQRQRDEQVEQPVDSPPGVPTLNQRVRIPTSRPVPDDSLPVQAIRGEHETMSAIAIDIASRGVTLGSEIDEFVLRLEESASREEFPSLNSDSAKIEACRITQYWPARYNDPRGADGQEWNTRPEFDDQACVLGVREAPAPGEQAAPIWTFDLTEIAQPWGEDPFDNQGVMLVSRLSGEPSETWHVQFKIPARDRSATEEDEYQETRNRLLVELAFVPGEPDVIEPPDPPDVDTSSPPPVTPSTTFGPSDFDTGTTTPPAPPTDTAPTEEPPVAAPPTTVTTETGPRMPSYVWALLPAGLLALGAVRSVVMEPAGGTRPDGVIAAIRRRNLERRGAPLRGSEASFGKALGAARDAAKRSGRAISRAATTVTRRLRRR